MSRQGQGSRRARGGGAGPDGSPDRRLCRLAEHVGGGGRQHRSAFQAGERVDLVAQGSVDGLVEANSDVERDIDLVRICRARRKEGL